MRDLLKIESVFYVMMMVMVVLVKCTYNLHISTVSNFKQMFYVAPMDVKYVPKDLREEVSNAMVTDVGYATINPLFSFPTTLIQLPFPSSGFVQMELFLTTDMSTSR